MKCLVTGGAGFIGSNLVRQLELDRHEVVVLDNLSSGYRSNLEQFKAARFVEGDIRDEAAVTEAIRGCEVVFHLAASVGNKRSIDNPYLDAEINVMGTIRVLEAARKAGVRKIVASSSAGIFGELKTLPIREDHPIDPDSPYGASKLCEEKECLAFAKVYGLEAVCLRYFNVYGPNQRFDSYGNVIPIFVFKMLRGEGLTIFGDGEQTRDFVNVKDVVSANIMAGMNKGVTGAFNVGSATRVTINRLVEMLGEVSGIQPIVQYGPNRIGDVRDSMADVGAANRAFGFTPNCDLQAGLREYFDWAKIEAKSR